MAESRTLVDYQYDYLVCCYKMQELLENSTRAVTMHRQAEELHDQLLSLGRNLREAPGMTQDGFHALTTVYKLQDMLQATTRSHAMRTQTFKEEFVRIHSQMVAIADHMGAKKPEPIGVPGNSSGSPVAAAHEAWQGPASIEDITRKVQDLVGSLV